MVLILLLKMVFELRLVSLNTKLMMRIFLVVGIVFILVGFVLVCSRLIFISESISAEGIVVDILKKVEEDETEGVFQPKVMFHTNDGEQISFISDVGSNPPAYNLGETVNVLYNPINPSNAEINSFLSLWLLQLVLILIGTNFVIISAVVLCKIRKGMPLGVSYNSEVSLKEFQYLIFNRKLCPVCGTRMRKEKKTKKISFQEAKAISTRWSSVNEYYDNHRVDLEYVCDRCSRIYTLKELAENK